MPSPTNQAPETTEKAKLAARLASLSPAQRDRLRQKLAKRQEASDSQPNANEDDAIAIVGMGCRFPGAQSLDEFWDLIEHGKEAVGPIPEGRWEKDRFFDPTGRTPGKMSVDAIGAIDDVDGFDPAFFGIAPREASRMDPQQRLLLEITWETFENAGIPVDSMAGSKTGVFIGIGGTDYSKVPARYPNYFDYVDAHIGTGNALSIAAGRISYIFDFQGPSFIVDTACSSALVAIHSAITSLQRGESDAAVAGGVNLILSPETTIAFSKARMLSPDGHCRPFDDGANGYVRGEGCGLVLLKRLSDAIRDGDQISGILRGSAVNQDGRTSGITAPNGAAQQRVIREALKAAKVTVDDVSYIEAHGTGTPLGDPIELGALAETFAKRDKSLPPIHVGSVKANIGHAETASGIAGLLKVLHMFKHRWIPSQANFKTLNSSVHLNTKKVRVADQSESWQPNPAGRFVAGVSSFGFGGTNSHIVVEKPSDEIASRSSDRDSGQTESRPALCLPLSTADEPALVDLAKQYSDLLENADDRLALDICGSASVQRTGLPLRAVALGETVSELKDSLASITDGLLSPSVVRGRKPAGRRPRIALLFTGQGSQYVGMARRLRETLPWFEQSLVQCANLLDEFQGISLLDLLDGKSSSPLDHTSMAQPAICAVQCALVDTFTKMGMRPDVVAGHSVGEIAALYAAGAFTLEQALQVAAIRGEVMGQLPSGGAMAAVLTSETEVQGWIQQADGSAVIATMNGEGNTVIAGSEGDVESVLQIAEANEVAYRRLKVSHAFHSPLMEAAAEPLRGRLTEVFTEARVPSSVAFISSVTGKRHTGPIDPDYWARHLMQAVRFTDVIDELGKSKLDLAIEVGPASALCGMIRRSSSHVENPLATVPTLDPKQDDFQGWLKAISSAWSIGAPVNWKAFATLFPFRQVSLPNYPFQHQRCWYDPPQAGNHGAGGSVVHPLLGVRQSLATGGTVFSAVVRENDPSYLSDHVVSGSVTVPAATWVEAIRAAAADAFPDGFALENIEMQRALFLDSGSRISLQTNVQLVGGSSCKIRIDAKSSEDPDSPWETCAAANAIKIQDAEPALPSAICVPDEAQSVDQEQLYQQLADSRLEYGELFQTLAEIRSDGTVAIASLVAHEELELELKQYQLHPTLLDGALQLIATVVPDQAHSQTFLPAVIDRVQLARGGPVHTAIVCRREPTDTDGEFNEVVADVQLLDAEATVVAHLKGVRLKSLQRDVAQIEDPSAWIHQVTWSVLPSTVAETQAVHAYRYFGSRRLRELIPASVEETDESREHWIWTAPESETNSLDASQVDSVTTDLLETIQAAIQSESAPIVSVIVESAFNVLGAESVDPLTTALAALTRVAANEHPQLDLRLLDVPSISEENVNAIGTWIQRDGDETELAVRNRRFYCPRMVPTPRAITGNPESEVSIPSQGSYRVRLDGSNRTEGLWVERIAAPKANRGEVALSVSAVGLNFSDVLKSMGLYPGISDRVVPMGIEVCGSVTEIGEGVNGFQLGQRVMGIVPYGFASDDATHDYLLVPVPENLNDEEAASLPVVFMTAHHALRHVARLRKGESVLIHAGAGGVGIAAIQVAHAIGATVFTTAGSPVKRQLLASMGVDPNNIFDSRDVCSIEEIRERTDGRGVDVVLNSLPGEWIDASLSLLAAHGRFLEIGKTDIYQDRPLGLRPFQDNLTYSAIDLDRIFRHREAEVRELFAEVANCFAQGVYQPLPLTSFRLDELPAAMRFMAARRNIGKIVVRPPAGRPDVARNEGVHLITGGSGAIALGVAKRLIERGAKAVALVARRDASDQVRQLQAWSAEQGAECVYLKSDCADEQSLRTAIDSLSAPVTAVIHAAGILDDGLIHEMTGDSMRRVLHPKVAGAIALDRATADHPVRTFTMLGSVAAVFGSPGQANYAAANAFLEGFAENRRGRGLPGNLVHWGPWGASSDSANAGMADDPTRIRNLESRGLTPLDSHRAIDLLIDAAASDCVSGVVVDADFGKMLAATTSPPSVLRDLKGEAAEINGGTASLVDTVFLAELAEAEAEDRPERLSGYFADALGKIMSMDPASIDATQSLGALGLDSLMAIELKNTLEAKLEITLPISSFMNDPTLQSLAEAAVESIGRRFAESANV